MKQYICFKHPVYFAKQEFHLSFFFFTVQLDGGSVREERLLATFCGQAHFLPGRYAFHTWRTTVLLCLTRLLTTTQGGGFGGQSSERQNLSPPLPIFLYNLCK